MEQDDDWDPFGDPANTASGCQAASLADEPFAAADAKTTCLAAEDLDVLQPWELEAVETAPLRNLEAAVDRGGGLRQRSTRGGQLLPSVAQLEAELRMEAGAKQQSGRVLRHTPELVDSAFLGDKERIASLLKSGADPNTILLREERLKGSDGCCACTITSEEYTPLIAATMSTHHQVVVMLLSEPSVDVNIVCHGVNQEFGPYKQFSALDLARRVKDQRLIDLLIKAGARPAEELPMPPWPRPPPETALAEELMQKAPQLNGGGRAAMIPAVEQSHPPEVVDAMSEVRAKLQDHCCEGPEARARLFKGLLLAWHPDKRPIEQADLATSVCQWLNGPGRCFLL